MAIEKGNIGILKALQEHRDQRKKQVPKEDLDKQQIECYEKTAWVEFWMSQCEQLLLYACLHGTVEIVKYFVTNGISPTASLDRYTPLCCAAKAGNYDITAYLLSLPGVTAEGTKTNSPAAPVKLYSPLMLASMYGHANCVTLLLTKESDIKVMSRRRYSFLMETIKAGHEEVATAIVRHDCWNETLKLRHNEKPTSMGMLIETMPDVAEKVLNRCLEDIAEESLVNYDCELIKEDPSSAIIIQASIQGSPTSAPNDDMKNVWWLINEEDKNSIYTEEEMKSNSSNKTNHPLTLMVHHERLNLLQHPLISRYIEYKWWRVVFPLLVLYLLLYIVFLILLTSFSLIVPRPGPENQYCPLNHSGPTYVELNFKDDECKDPDGDQKGWFTALAVLLLLLSYMFVVLLVLEVGFRLYCLMLQNLTWFDICLKFKLRMVQTLCETVLRAGVFFLTIIFVFGFWNDCWCAPPWQWQIGALAVFLAYISIILLLKGMPIVGVLINMLLNIVITFLKLIYLPVLLILAFAIPFHMLFVRDGPAVLVEAGPGILEAFSTPAHSMAKVIMQTAGDLDYESIFNEADLLYSPMAYLLFIIFVVLMPILFINLLVGLAVGTTDEDRKRAIFTNIKLQVDYIVDLEIFGPFRCTNKLSKLVYRDKPDANLVMLWWNKWRGVDYETQQRVVKDANNNTFAPNDENKEKMTQLERTQRQLKESVDTKISHLERQLQESMEANKQLRSSIEELLRNKQQ